MKLRKYPRHIFTNIFTIYVTILKSFPFDGRRSLSYSINLTRSFASRKLQKYRDPLKDAFLQHHFGIVWNLAAFPLE